MTELCNCGTCEQAVDRGTEFVLKQLRDGSCPVFIQVVLDAATVVLTSAAAMNEDGKHTLLSVLEAELWLNKAQREGKPVIDRMRDDLNTRIHTALKAVEKRMEEEGKPPKGD